MCSRQSLGKSERATSDGQIDFSGPRRTTRDKMQSKSAGCCTLDEEGCKRLGRLVGGGALLLQRLRAKSAGRTEWQKVGLRIDAHRRLSAPFS